MKRALMYSGALAMALTALSVSTPALAQDEGGSFLDNVSAFVGVTSDYRFRGISQSDEEAALQAGAEYAHDSGFFFGVWGSSVEFNDAPRDTWAEIDLYIGYAGALSENTSWSGQAVYYWYPDSDIAGSPDYDYWEFIFGLDHTMDQVTLSGQVAWSPEYFGETGDEFYVAAMVGYDINEWLNLSGGVGHSWLDDAAGEDYVDYNLGVTATLDILSIDLRWIGTDLDDVETADDTFVATVSLNF